MKERQLMKGAAFMLLAATATLPAHAQLKTNAGMIMPRYNEVRQVFYIIMYMTVYWEWQILVKWFHSHLSQ